MPEPAQQRREVRGDLGLERPAKDTLLISSYAASAAAPAAASSSTSRVSLTARSIGSAFVSGVYEVPGSASWRPMRCSAQVLSLMPYRPVVPSRGAVTPYGSVPSVQSRRVSADAPAAPSASGASSFGTTRTGPPSGVSTSRVSRSVSAGGAYPVSQTMSGPGATTTPASPAPTASRTVRSIRAR